MGDESELLNVTRGMSGGQFFSFVEGYIAAQQRYDMAKPGESVQIDHELMPFINRTEK